MSDYRYRSNSGLFSLGGSGSQENLLRSYSKTGTVYSIVSLLAQSVSRCEWHLFKKQPVDGRVRYTTSVNPVDMRTEVTKHAALSLLSKPNDFWTRKRLFGMDETYMGLAGESFWVLDRSQGVNFPTAIWSVRPDRMEPVTDPKSYLAGWVYTSPDGHAQIPLATDEVIQFAYPNPMDEFRGIGPVQSILMDIEAANYSSQWNRNFFLNSARPDGIITTPDSLTDDEFKQLQNRWREAHKGISRAHSVAVLEDGQSWSPTSTNPKDMDFSGLRGLDRDLIREAFRMHRIMLGTTDDVNRANAQTGEEIFASWEIVPRLDLKKDILNEVFLPMFGSSAMGLEFDYVTPVPPNREEDRLNMAATASAAEAYVNAGYDPHDVLQMLGVPDMGVAERATQQPGLPPGWVPSGQPALPAPNTESEPDDETAQMTARLVRMLSNGHIPVGSGSSYGRH